MTTTTINKMDEKILAVKRAILFDDEMLAFQGVMVKPAVIRDIKEGFSSLFEVRRGDAEENNEWKQPIPYAIIRRGNEIFLYKRLQAGGEARLHDQLSIGVGGHMNKLGDWKSWDYVLMENLYREVMEELHIGMAKLPTPKIIGLINDDKNPVGRVHIGILAVIDLPMGVNVTVRETDQLEGYWVRTQDLLKTPLFENLESWSQIAAKIL